MGRKPIQFEVHFESVWVPCPPEQVFAYREAMRTLIRLAEKYGDKTNDPISGPEEICSSGFSHEVLPDVIDRQQLQEAVPEAKIQECQPGQRMWLRSRKTLQPVGSIAGQ